jgi:4-hydroxybenzoate polyprenyltransferase
MMQTAVVVLYALTRFDTCAIVFLSVLLPVYFLNGDLELSLRTSLPVLTICMCGFVINDLSDQEKDATNHPQRPLPSGAIGEVAASIVYFTLLAVSLFVIKMFVAPTSVYLYALLLIALINYNYVVAYVPLVKNVYVATAGLLPIIIVGSLVEAVPVVERMIPSLFLFLLGREMLMDVQDASGDGKTPAKMLGPRTTENVAFTLKVVGSAGLALVVGRTRDTALVIALVVLDFLFLWMWKRRLYRRLIIHLMKLQLLAGIYFLIEQEQLLNPI